MKPHVVRHLLLLVLLIVFAAAILVPDTAKKSRNTLPEELWPQACAADETNVTTFLTERTDLVSDLGTRWKHGCPGWLCGRDTDKFIRLDLVCMKKIGADTYQVRAIGTAGAKFHAFTPLSNLQTVSAAATVDYDSCSITLTRKLAFKQPAVTTVTGFFVSVGNSVSIRDSAKGNRCGHYRPPEAG